MINPKDIEISQIKDLNLLFFYSVNGNSTDKGKLCLGLKVDYGKNQSIALDYTSDVWNEFVSKVIMTYNKEKDGRDIILLGEFSKFFVDKSATISKFSSEIKENSSQSDPISVISSRNFQIQIIKDYLKEVAQILLSLFHTEGSFQVTEVRGYRDRYVVKYTVEGEENFFPMIVTRTIEDHFNFEIGMVEGENFHIDGDIDLGNDYVNVIWKDSKRALIGKSIYNIEGNVNEKLVKCNGEMIYFEEDNSEISKDDMEKINFYLNLAGLETIQKGFKTVKNNYILSETSLENDGTNNVSLQKSCHIKFDGDYVHLIYKNSTGLSKYDDMLIVPMYEEAQEILFIPFEVEGKQYVLLQRAWIPRDVTRGDYKEKLLNRYYYSVFEIELCCDWVNGFVPCDSFKVTEQVDTMEDLVNYVMKRKSVK